MKVTSRGMFLSIIALQTCMQAATFSQSEIEQMIENRYKKSFGQFYLGSIDPMVLDHWKTIIQDAGTFVQNNITLDHTLTDMWNAVDNANNTLVTIMQEWNRFIKSGMGDSATARQSAQFLTPHLNNLKKMQTSKELNKSYLFSGNNKAAAMMQRIIGKLVPMITATQTQLNIYKSTQRR